jgi:hypothetical protein
LREITASVRNSTEPDVIMRSAIRELGTALGRRTFIRLGDAERSVAAGIQQSRPPQVMVTRPLEEASNMSQRLATQIENSRRCWPTNMMSGWHRARLCQPTPDGAS